LAHSKKATYAVDTGGFYTIPAKLSRQLGHAWMVAIKPIGAFLLRFVIV
jgi:hypothetical protein